MALDLTNFDPTGSGSKGGMKIATYDAGADTIAIIEAANYFDNSQLTSVMNTGDMLVVSAADGLKIYGMTIVETIGSETMTLVEAVGAGEQIVMSDQSLDCIGANGATAIFVAPFDCEIVAIKSILLVGALTTADTVITADIETVAVTGGVLTITQSGSAAGDVDTVSPTALKAASEGDVITLTVSGTQDAARFASVYLILKKTTV